MADCGRQFHGSSSSSFQDLFKSSPSLKREVVGELIMAWWGHTTTQNVATVSVGTSTRQFVKKPSGSWFSPGPGTFSALAQTSSPVVSLRNPVGYASCVNALHAYIPTRGWSYSGVSFTLTGPKGDVQTFGDWTNQMADTSASTCAEQRGFRMSGWVWLNGAALSYNYARPTGYTTQIETLSYVFNNLSVRLNFTNGGFGGFTNNLTSTNLRQVTTAMAGSQVSHTDPGSYVSKFDISTLGSGDFAKLRIQNVYTADDGTNPATQYLRDSLGRVQQMRDRLVLAGARAPTQYYLANGLRGETVNAAGYSSIIYADLNGHTIRSISPLGAVTTSTYDGRGRVSVVNTPDGGQVQFQYGARNLPTQKTILANAGSGEAGQTIVTQFGWDTTNSLMLWSKDAKGAQTDYNYSGGELTVTQHPAAKSGAPRLTATNYFYSNGQPLGLQGRVPPSGVAAAS